jgi:type IV pilus assembly protein PilQ
VTSSSEDVTATSISGDTEVQSRYPVIDVRETQTQILIKDGETIVMGGLLKDIKSKSMIGIPFLSKIPILGKLFSRETTTTSKVDLLIFITAHVMTDSDYLSSPHEIAKLQSEYGWPVKKEKEEKPKKRK